MGTAQDHRIVGTSTGVPIVGTATNVSLNGTTLAMGWAVQAESTEAITHVWFRGGARTGTPPTYLIRIELLDTAGNPDGVDAGGGAPTAKTFTPPADTSWNGVGQWIALTNSWTPTTGQRFAIVIRHSSGTCDASNFFSFTSGVSVVNNNNRNFPCTLSFNGTSWSKGITSWTAAWRGATGYYGYPTTGGVTVTGSSTAGRRVAAVITIPTARGTSSTCLAFEGVFDIGNLAGTIVFGIWDSAGTVIDSVTIDTDELASNAARSTRIVMPNQPTLTHGTEYYFGMEATGGGPPTIAGLQLGAAADRAAFPGGTTRAMATWDGTAWTKDETVFPLIEITAGDITIPAGGSGAIIIGGLGMTGIGSF